MPLDHVPNEGRSVVRHGALLAPSGTVVGVEPRVYILVDVMSLHPTTDGHPAFGRVAAYGSEDTAAAIRRPLCRGHAVP